VAFVFSQWKRSNPFKILIPGLKHLVSQGRTKLDEPWPEILEKTGGASLLVVSGAFGSFFGLVGAVVGAFQQTIVFPSLVAAAAALLLIGIGMQTSSQSLGSASVTFSLRTGAVSALALAWLAGSVALGFCAGIHLPAKAAILLGPALLHLAIGYATRNLDKSDNPAFIFGIGLLLWAGIGMGLGGARNLILALGLRAAAPLLMTAFLLYAAGLVTALMVGAIPKPLKRFTKAQDEDKQ
jgi:hypothetical protein